jgi:two-component system chemotaxis response regulator CheY
MKSLVVDDDFTHRLLLQRFLSSTGEVHIAANGREAVTAVHEAIKAGQPYDLVCLDIQMPLLDGHHALEEIREIEQELHMPTSKHVKVVMTTAHTEKGHVLDAFRQSADAYLTKPVSKDKLLGFVHEWKLG